MPRHRRGPRWPTCLLVLPVMLAGCGSSATHPLRPAGEAPLVRGTRFPLLKAAKTFAYQIQGLEIASRRQALYASDYDLYVLEPTRTVKGSTGFDTRGMVTRLKNAGGRRRLVIAYLDIAEAEKWRTYWQSTWHAPRNGQPGFPSFIVAPDPDGWGGDFPVAYWDPAWQAIVATGPGSLLNLAIDDGFDGLYMDWVEGYADRQVKARARQDGVNAVAEMLNFIQVIRTMAQQRDPDFLVIAQNAPDLITGHPNYPQLIDGMGQEDLHYRGAADVKWTSPRSGDIRTPVHGDYGTLWLQARLDQYLAAGLPVFVIDYCVNEQHRLDCYQLSRARGYVPFVSRTPLDRLPSPPPPP